MHGNDETMTQHNQIYQEQLVKTFNCPRLRIIFEAIRIYSHVCYTDLRSRR